MGFLDKLFPPGKMNMTMPKTAFTPGESVSGTISLEMKKPINARALEVTVYAIKEVRKTRDTRDGRESYTENVTVFESTQSLGGEQDYPGGQYNFSILIPEGVFGADMPDLKGAIGDTIEAAGNFLKDMSKKNIKWYVNAKLDIPGGRDISKKVKITVI